MNKMARTRKPQSPALQYLQREFIGDDPETLDELEQEGVNADIAQMIYDMRKEAALTQAQLAEKVGTARSVISRLEDADYEGHSLSMLRRIAGVLNKRVELSLVDLDEQEVV
jgi:ribosome-binding protein aMBF1 (putative translation factor)